MKSLVPNIKTLIIIHVTISKIWTAVLPVRNLLNSTFWLINGPKKATVWNWWYKSNFNKRYEVILPFWYQSHDHFKNVDCSTSSLIFARFNFSANKWLYGQKLWSHLFYQPFDISHAIIWKMWTALDGRRYNWKYSIVIFCHWLQLKERGFLKCDVDKQRLNFWRLILVHLISCFCCFGDNV